MEKTNQKGKETQPKGTSPPHNCFIRILPPFSVKTGTTTLKEGKWSGENEGVFLWAGDAALGGAGGSRWDTKALCSNILAVPVGGPMDSFSDFS